MVLTELALIAAVLAPAALLEVFWPRLHSPGKARRWAVNVTLAVTWVVLLNLSWPWIHPLVSTSSAAIAIDPPQLTLHPVALVLGSLLLLDFLQYWTHRLLHITPWLWVLHRVHHSDGAVDASTGVRHHPVEPLLNAPFQFFFIVVLQVPFQGAAAYALVAIIQTIVAHSNIRLPLSLDAWLRWIVVTPDVHRIHHSIRPEEANSNFGMVFPYWDYLFGTYRSAPVDGLGQFRAGVR